jgi:ADP-ribose pyrophosphatase YjhB (NUDIX family)
MDTKRFPFKRITVRAIILRRADGALYGVLHLPTSSFSPPGGAIESGETTEQTLLRELEEEQIRLIAPDAGWVERIAVDYFHGKHELNIWYIFLVDDVQQGTSEEILEGRWLDQSQDVWYPGMREKIFLAIRQYLPDMLRLDVTVLESW